MRSEKEIINLILDIAKKDNHIECDLLNGSKANPNSMKDKFQDYDFIF
ncbi:aminoglycoside 6-adenylyltransferase [Mammaliicoccus vitulinus]|nr:aminoglycoside 6-adenylyltransferase [Mammaliicoccus vitulinus]MBM6629078.1 aminoglycoside 6-adenylyltransferase [Mammaliicoccus vitulinus]MBO3076156.1 aminoglycoside 6-adenylyltransferase [Mammaliicoccus vitulinus]WQK88518.1 aminoglycoside 6-adenylyltransferase [Mammaliicoccus vitulinus]